MVMPSIKLFTCKSCTVTKTVMSTSTAAILMVILMMSATVKSNEQKNEDSQDRTNEQIEQEFLPISNVATQQQDGSKKDIQEGTDSVSYFNVAQQQDGSKEEIQEITDSVSYANVEQQQEETKDKMTEMTDPNSYFNVAQHQEDRKDEVQEMADFVSYVNVAQHQEDKKDEVQEMADFVSYDNEVQQQDKQTEKVQEINDSVSIVIEQSQEGPNEESMIESVYNFIRVTNSPEILTQGSKVMVEYYCEENSVVVVDLTVMMIGAETYFTVFSKAWNCYGQGQEGNLEMLQYVLVRSDLQVKIKYLEVKGKPKVKSVQLKLPDSLVYRPDYFLKADNVWLVNSCKLRAWLVDEIVWRKEGGEDVYASSKSRDIHKVTVLPPYSRPYREPACTVWIWPYVQKLHTFSDFKTCAAEEEYVTLLNYPAVFNGYTYGIIKELSPFKDPALERERIQRRHFPQFTIEMWVYILEYCPFYHLMPASACGLFVHMNNLGSFLNPAIFINKDGNVQVDMMGSNGFIGMRSTDVVPKNKWARILFTFNERQWILHVNHGPDLKDGFWTTHTYDENLYMDDTEWYMSIGGIDWTLGSFVGYMGRVVYHRRKALVPNQLSLPDQSHPMFELHLARRHEKCDNFLSWMDAAVTVFQKFRRYIIQQQEDICSNEPLLFFMRYLSSSSDVTTCPPMNPHNFQQYRQMSRVLRKAVIVHSLSNNFLNGSLEAYSRNFQNDSQAALLHEISVELLETAKLIVSKNGLKDSRRIVHLLKQAACLGNDDAMFTLAVMLNNGVGCAPDEIQSLAFFMLGTLNRHTLSTMALGHRHIMGIDGAHVDKEVAYLYYKQVADITRTQKETHQETGIATETIRLIDEASIEAQTSEVGDLFLWLKNQAEKGVASAQSQLGAMLYHGAQGIKRNLQTAINVFRDGAEMGNVDAMFSYGIMQYRGMGAKANKTEGKRMLMKAAELNNPNAVSALGWVALVIDKNYTQAYEMFLLAKQLGHMDSGYYLGYMHHFGMVPNNTFDMDKAMEEYLWSAKREQVDAGNMYAFLQSRGTPSYRRDITNAVQWARFIAEKNSHLAIPFRDALNSFRIGNHDLALYLYLMLADTGLEVASFNLAYLCEQNKNDVKLFMSKECEWRHYNLSTQREPHFVDAYSFIKMGDYYWYGCLGQRNLHEAARHYSQAALKGNPQALFNLAYMVEEGAEISPVIWWTLHFTPDIYTNKVALLLELYSRCRESRQNEAFVPCCLAWFRVWCLDFSDQYNIQMKITSFLGIFLAAVTSSYLLYSHYRQRSVDRDDEEKRLAMKDEEERGKRKEEDEIRREEEGERRREEEEEGIGIREEEDEEEREVRDDEEEREETQDM